MKNVIVCNVILKMIGRCAFITVFFQPERFYITAVSNFVLIFSFENIVTG